MPDKPLSRLSEIAGSEELADQITQIFNTGSAVNRLMTFSRMNGVLNVKQRRLTDWLLTLKPKHFNLSTPFYGLQEPEDGSHFIAVSRRLIDGEGNKYKTVQYVPLEVYLAFSDMEQAFLKTNPKKQLILYSAYRSPAYQTMLIVYYLTKNKYDLAKVLKRVALPGYSEHGLIDSTALDLDNDIGHPAEYDDIEFENTQQYGWLLKNAKSFGFNLSYPPNNPEGIDYEPWHWRYTSPKTA